MHTALITGSFDPITVGHMQLVETASRLFDEVSSIYGQVYDTRGYALAALANGAVTFVYGPFMTLTSLTIGAVAAKKHKIIAAFATYYIISVIVSIVSTVVQTAMTIAAFASDKAPSMAAAQLPVYPCFQYRAGHGSLLQYSGAVPASQPRA